MIGQMDKCTKVHKLWFGLRKEIQHDLWRDRLNPEISSLQSVIASAEIIEIMQSVTRGGPELKNKRKGTLPVVRSTATTPDGKCRREHQERGCPTKKYPKWPPRDQQSLEESSWSRSEKQYNSRSTEREAGEMTQPKMSNEEWEWLKAEGLCFVCYKPGHFIRKNQ